jgi:hypothetical protein
LQYNNLEDEEDKEETKEQIANPYDYFQISAKEESKQDKTPSFAMKHILNKFSDIKSGFDSEKMSSENGINKKRDTLATIIEHDSEEEEKTDRIKYSEISDESNFQKIDERESNIYIINMQSLKFRDSATKNPFKDYEEIQMEEIIEIEEVPDEEEISGFNSMSAPRLISTDRQLEISGSRGSSCYCWYVRT